MDKNKLDNYTDTSNAITFDAVQANGNNGANYAPGDLPTHANSTKQTAPALSAEFDAPAHVADACC